ncbi:MAG TPA: class I SAM-dependent methyltransferase [Phycisphaerales bacterium]|nr:class I SAM-dependent methyltransferase [Phycisphaerales bacterium]
MPTPIDPTLSADYQRDWPAYFDAVAGLPPRDTLYRALELFGAEPAAGPRLAIDLACGEGRDTRELLSRGWRVLAVDAHADALRRLEAHVPESGRARLRTRLLAMEAVPADPDLALAADLINASFALPFCHEDRFEALWNWIGRTLRPGARFAGQLFGDRDEWAPVNPRRHVTRAQALALLSEYRVEHFDEAEKVGPDAMGGTKHHHVFHIVAQKRE